MTLKADKKKILGVIGSLTLEAAGVAGFGLIVYGIQMMHQPAAMIFAGVVIVGVCLKLAGRV